jgi:hypothetical protein
MEHDDKNAHVDSLRREQPHLPLRGNHSDSNPEFADERKGGGARAFAATTPEFVLDILSRNRNRVACSGDTQGSSFRTSDTMEPCLHHWKNNHVVNTIQEWGSQKGLFPNLAPITKAVKSKHSVHNVFSRKMSSTAGDQTDKTELFPSNSKTLSQLQASKEKWPSRICKTQIRMCLCSQM